MKPETPPKMPRAPLVDDEPQICAALAGALAPVLLEAIETRPARIAGKRPMPHQTKL